MRYSIITLIYTGTWFGFSLGFIYQINDFISFTLSLLFSILLYIFMYKLVKKEYYFGEKQIIVISKNMNYFLSLLMIYYALVGVLLLVNQIFFDGSSIEFRMFAFDKIIENKLYILIFIISNIVVVPLSYILMQSDFGKLSYLAYAASLLVNIGFNSRFGILFTLILLCIQYRDVLNFNKLFFISSILIIMYATMTYYRMSLEEYSFMTGVQLIITHNLDYLTISAPLYKEYVSNYNYGSVYAPFTFIETILSKIFNFKGVEGMIADISSEVLFFTEHDTGPYNAFFTALAIFASPYEYTGMVYGFSTILILVLGLRYVKNGFLVKYQMMLIMLSGFMPNLFTLAWFFGSCWCIFLMKFSKTKG